MFDADLKIETTSVSALDATRTKVTQFMYDTQIRASKKRTKCSIHKILISMDNSYQKMDQENANFDGLEAAS